MRFSILAISLLCSTLPFEVLALSITHEHVSRSDNKPVINTNFQDPSLIEVDGTWYAFAGANGNSKGINVQVATSPDFSTWTLRKGYDALPVLGAWHVPHAGHLWSPDVSQLADGTFIMYYAADRNLKGHHSQHCIGAATSPNIMGPYMPLNETFACNLKVGGAIDPDGFIDLPDPDQARYVVYKIDGNSIGHGGFCKNTKKPIVPTPIMLQKVASDGYTKIEEPVELIRNIPSDGPNIEAPALIYDPTRQLYILFFNAHCFTTLTYRILYATSKTLLGPYTRGEKPFLASGYTKADVHSPGGIDFNANSKNYTKFVFQADLNLEWFHNKGKRDRGLFVASLEVDDKGVATLQELF